MDNRLDLREAAIEKRAQLRARKVHLLHATHEASRNIEITHQPNAAEQTAIARHDVTFGSCDARRSGDITHQGEVMTRGGARCGHAERPRRKVYTGSQTRTTSNFAKCSVPVVVYTVKHAEKTKSAKRNRT